MTSLALAFDLATRYPALDSRDVIILACPINAGAGAIVRLSANQARPRSDTR